MTKRDYPHPVSKLLDLGECGRGTNWLDYLALSLGPEHVPDLIRMALDEDLHAAESDSDAVWAPVHAWRALAQLGAAEAVRPLTTLLRRIDEHDDDWVNEELPGVFSRIGPTAIPVLADYLQEDDYGLFARIAAADALAEISIRHPTARHEALDALTAALKHYDELDPGLNAFLIEALVDLDAVEAASLIEQAFDAGRVDPTVMGDWDDVQVELGLLDRPTRVRPRPFFEGFLEAAAADQERARVRLRQTGRNDPCWCGSTQKYKHCHLREDQQTARG